MKRKFINTGLNSLASSYIFKKIKCISHVRGSQTITDVSKVDKFGCAHATKLDCMIASMALNHDIDFEDEKGYTALHYAVLANDEFWVEKLLCLSADVDGYHENNPLYLAVNNGFEAIAFLLLDYGADSEQVFIHAVAEKDITALKWLIKHQLGYESLSNRDMNVLFNYAISLNSLRLMKLLATTNVNFNEIDIQEQTLLFLALSYGYQDIAYFLVEKGINLLKTFFSVIDNFFTRNTIDNKQYDAHNDVKIIEWLLDNGLVIKSEVPVWLSADSGDVLYTSLLSLAAEAGYVDVVELLLNRQAPVNVRDSLQGTPLHRTLLYDCGQEMNLLQLELTNYKPYLKTIKRLITFGADIQALDCEQQTPLDLANPEVANKMQFWAQNRDALYLAYQKKYQLSHLLYSTVGLPYHSLFAKKGQCITAKNFEQDFKKAQSLTDITFYVTSPQIN